MPVDPLTIAAVRNNARWCDAVCRGHGIPTRFDPDAWTAGERTPPFYPDAVTLTPHVDAQDLLRRIDATAGASIKDSFATLDLATAGFRVLFDADWIRHDPYGGVMPAGWAPVTTGAGLANWAAAHGGGPTFAPVLLDDPDVTFLLAHDHDRILAGAIAYRSDAVVSLSNLFSVADLADDGVWATAGAAVSACYPDLPVVGYESGGSLQDAERAGFTRLAPLRVWLSPAG